MQTSKTGKGRTTTLDIILAGCTAPAMDQIWTHFIGTIHPEHGNQSRYQPDDLMELARLIQLARGSHLSPEDALQTEFDNYPGNSMPHLNLSHLPAVLRQFLRECPNEIYLIKDCPFNEDATHVAAYITGNATNEDRPCPFCREKYHQADPSQITVILLSHLLERTVNCVCLRG